MAEELDKRSKREEAEKIRTLESEVKILKKAIYNDNLPIRYFIFGWFAVISCYICAISVGSLSIFASVWAIFDYDLGGFLFALIIGTILFCCFYFPAELIKLGMKKMREDSIKETENDRTTIN